MKARDIERKKAIAEGKMDDPLVPKRLDQAITMVGTCTDMCPRFERYRRERENNLDRWEVVCGLLKLPKFALILLKIPGTKRVDHKRAVKIYERAAGDKTLPSDLRPPPVLKASPFDPTCCTREATLPTENLELSLPRPYTTWRIFTDLQLHS